MEQIRIEIQGVEIEVFFHFYGGQRGDFWNPPIADDISIEKVECDCLNLLCSNIDLEDVQEKVIEKFQDILIQNNE